MQKFDQNHTKSVSLLSIRDDMVYFRRNVEIMAHVRCIFIVGLEAMSGCSGARRCPLSGWIIFSSRCCGKGICILYNLFVNCHICPFGSYAQLSDRSAFILSAGSNVKSFQICLNFRGKISSRSSARSVIASRPSSHLLYSVADITIATIRASKPYSIVANASKAYIAHIHS